MLKPIFQVGSVLGQSLLARAKVKYIQLIYYQLAETQIPPKFFIGTLSPINVGFLFTDDLCSIFNGVLYQ